MNKLKILVSPDKFKYSLTADQICSIFRDQLPSSRFSVRSVPLGDGGEGSLDAISKSIPVQKISLQVHDPLLRKIKTEYLFQADTNTAYIEMAKASGLDLLSKNQRNPLLTSTFGTGELIKHALEQQKCRKVYLFIGGSATNEGGIGMAKALGFKFFDQAGNELPSIGQDLNHIRRITGSIINRAEFIIATDVKNTLLGPLGATMVFGRQKGASDTTLASIEAGMTRFTNVLESHFQMNIKNIPGSGAAGGLGAGGLAFLKAKIEGGISTIMNIVGYQKYAEEADVIITGEGKLDQQTLHGKVIHGVVEVAKKYGKRVIVVCGKSEVSPDVFGQSVQIVPLLEPGMQEEYSIKNAEILLRKAINNKLSFL